MVAPGADRLLLVMQVSEGLPAFSADLDKSVIYPWTAVEIPCISPAKSRVLSSEREVLICCWTGSLGLELYLQGGKNAATDKVPLTGVSFICGPPPFSRTPYFCSFCVIFPVLFQLILWEVTLLALCQSLAFPERNESFTWWKKTDLTHAEYKCLESLIITTFILLLICVGFVCLFCFLKEGFFVQPWLSECWD